MRKIGVYGISGSYTNEVASQIFADHEFIYESSMQQLLKDTESGKVSCSVVPVENNLVGRVDHFHLYINKFDITIIGEKFKNINHKLLGVKGTKIEDIKEVYSHHMALKQCDNFINKHNIIPVEETDTATAAEYIANTKDKSKAAIASSVCAPKYGLEVINEGISNETNNMTRFFVITKRDNTEDFGFEEADKRITSIIFTLKSKAGALYDALGAFAKNNINLTRIESQIDSSFVCVSFFVDFEGDSKDEKVKSAFEELEKHSDLLTLGSYNADVNFRK